MSPQAPFIQLHYYTLYHGSKENSRFLKKKQKFDLWRQEKRLTPGMMSV
jgi:hypothetical protein